jgi:glycosyltransferase involved in cell wall biosynthesis
MKLLHVISSMNPQTGGTSEAIRSLVPELEKLGVYNEVVCLNDPSDGFLKNELLTIHALAAAKGPWQFSSKLIPWLRDNMVRFDAILVHGLWLFSSYAVWKVAVSNKGQIPYFMMPHGMLDPYFQQAEGRKLKALRNWIYWKLIENRVVQHASGLLFTTDLERQEARGTFQPYRPKQEITINYGISAPPPALPAMRKAFLEQCPEVATTPYLLFLSRINYKKGLDLLVEAYSQLIGSGIDKPLPRLVIAGPGLDSPYGQQIKQMISQRPELNGLFIFPGMLSGDAKWGALYGCDAFILPSHQENFGIAVVEALACGKPVLISDKVNIWPAISDNGCGFVAEDSVEGTIQLLTRWMDLQPDNRERMQQNAQLTFEKKFHIMHSANAMLNAVVSKHQYEASL